MRNGPAASGHSPRGMQTDAAERVADAIFGQAVYGLIQSGELAAGKRKDGLVYVVDSALLDYRGAHHKRRASGSYFGLAAMVLTQVALVLGLQSR